MIGRRSVLRCILGAIVVGAAGSLSADLHAQGVFKHPSPGEVYKEYMQITRVGSEVAWPGSTIAVRYGVAVPIQLASLSAAVVEANRAVVQSSTLSNTNNFGCKVRKAANRPANFRMNPRRSIAGAGTTPDPALYSFADPVRPGTVVYYRLKQIDPEGSVRYLEPFRLDVLASVAGKAVPQKYALSQAYPNPFNPPTRIRFSLPVPGAIQVRVFSQVCQTVHELVNEYKTASPHEVTCDADGLPGGLYEYRMESGPFVDAKKVVLLR